MKKKPSLDEVLAECDENAPIHNDMKEWLNMPDVGREKINAEDLEDFDTAEFLNNDEAIVKFLKDIVKDRDPELLDHAVSIIKRRWNRDSELTAMKGSAAGILKGIPINNSVRDEESLQSNFDSEVSKSVNQTNKAIDEALDFVEESNKRIEAMEEEHAKKFHR